MTNLDTIVAVYAEGSGPIPIEPRRKPPRRTGPRSKRGPKRVSSMSPTARWSKTATARR